MTAETTDVLRNSASDALDQLQRAATPALKQGKRQVLALVDQGGDLFESVSNEASETANEVGAGLISYTKKNPLIALLLAVGVGALLVSAAKSTQSHR